MKRRRAASETMLRNVLSGLEHLSRDEVFAVVQEAQHRYGLMCSSLMETFPTDGWEMILRCCSRTLVCSH